MYFGSLGLQEGICSGGTRYLEITTMKWMKNEIEGLGFVQNKTSFKNTPKSKTLWIKSEKIGELFWKRRKSENSNGNSFSITISTKFLSKEPSLSSALIPLLEYLFAHHRCVPMEINNVGFNHVLSYTMETRQLTWVPRHSGCPRPKKTTCRGTSKITRGWAVWNRGKVVLLGGH